MTDITDNNTIERFLVWIMKSFLKVIFPRNNQEPLRPPTKAPTPPGELLEKFILPRLKLNETKVSQASGISPEDLKKIFVGDAAITEDILGRLRPVLGDAVTEIISKHQAASDHYKQHGAWPPPSRRI